MQKRGMLFISATTQGLQGYRQIVSEVLQAQGFGVVVQETFCTPDKPILQKLREGICGCCGMVALVGPYYGVSSGVSKDGACLSYTQFELEYALTNRLPTLALFTNRHFQPEAGKDGQVPSEADEYRNLQEAFIQRVRSRTAGLGWASFRDRLELALILAKTNWMTYFP